MKVFALTSAVPYRAHGEPGVTAVNIVCYALVRELARAHEVTLQVILPPSRKVLILSESERRALEVLKSEGVRVAEPVFPAQYVPAATATHFRTLQLLVSPSERLAHFYPASRASGLIHARLREGRIDAVLPLWSVEGAAAVSGSGVPAVVYHGDIDYEPHLHQFRDRALFQGAHARMGLLTSIDRRLRLAMFKRAHVALMRDFPVIANVTASNCGFYSRVGCLRSIYAGNTWVDPGRELAENAIAHARADESGPIKIIGHTGYLNRTGGTYGLQFLLRDVLPELAILLKDRTYEIHIIGGGEIAPGLRQYLSDPHLRLRGFVRDLDAELVSSDIALLLNNAGPYLAGYTRHLVAWSMGLCLIVHAGSVAAIPEIAPGENALVGSTGREVAEWIVRAAEDRVLNEKIRRGGRETFERHFRPETVAARLEKALVDAVSGCR